MQMALWFEVAYNVVDDDGTVIGATVHHRQRGVSSWTAQTASGTVIGAASTRLGATALVTAHYDGRPILSVR